MPFLSIFRGALDPPRRAGNPYRKRGVKIGYFLPWKPAIFLNEKVPDFLTIFRPFFGGQKSVKILGRFYDGFGVLFGPANGPKIWRLFRD